MWFHSTIMVTIGISRFPMSYATVRQGNPMRINPLMHKMLYNYRQNTCGFSHLYIQLRMSSDFFLLRIFVLGFL